MTPAGATIAWRLRTVAKLTTPAIAVVGQASTIRSMSEHLPVQPARTLYVVDGLRELVATVDPRVVLADVEHRDVDPDQQVLDVSTPTRAALTPDMSLTAALEVFLRDDDAVLPVVAGQWRAMLRANCRVTT